MRLDQLVELKGGETFNGHLVSCDSFMNIILLEVYQTSAEGDRYWKLKECYIRGSTVSCTPMHLHIGFRSTLHCRYWHFSLYSFK